ncbi:MAG TPA: DUF4142 domain-containing protein [Chitinophagaceae bacterium]|jgi:putative membrane protein|nr:DUF4142 domain-containing protein [Chitinophagaceae bacterium]
MELKKVLLAGTVAVAGLFTACDKNDDDDIAASQQDKDFAVQASMSNRAEIQMGNLALQQATDASVRTFAQMMVTEHTTAQEELEDISDDMDLNVSLNDSLPASVIDLRTTLAALSGPSFDSAYIATQVVAHQAALQLFQTEVNSGSHRRMIEYANKYLPKVQMHYNMADTMAARVSD